MAAGSSRVAGAAAASSPLNYIGRSPDCHIRHETWAPWRYYINIQTKKISRQIIFSACKLANTSSNVLDDSRAWWVHRERHGHSTIPASTKWGPAIVFCTILLLCGDVQLNPGPRTLDICQAVVSGFPKPMHCAVLNGAGSRGNTPANTMSGRNIGQMLMTPVPSRSIPTNPTQAISCLKQQQMKLFQTVNQANVLWDVKTKLKGIFGGHLNIWSIVSKTEQLEHLLMGINYLCLTETWLTPKTHCPRI